MTRLAHTIAHLHEERAAANAARRDEAHDRLVAVQTQLDDTRKARNETFRAYQAASLATRLQRAQDAEALLGLHSRSLQARHRHRLDLAAAQRRHLAEFMTDLTATVSSLRADFVADLEGQRAALRSAAQGIHAQLDAARRDREGGGAALRGVHHPETALPEPSAMPAAPAAAAPQPKAPEPAPAPRLATSSPKPTPPAEVIAPPPPAARAPAAAAPAEGGNPA
jgi:hypothetical protein